MVEDLESEVVNNEDILLLYLVHFLDVRAVGPGDAKQGKELLCIPVEDFLSLETGLVSQSSSNVAFTHTGGPCNDDVLGPVDV